MAADPKVKPAAAKPAAKPRASRAKKTEEPAASTAVAVATPAQVLSAEDKEAQSAAAFVLMERVKEGMAAGRQALWVLASALYEFEETAGWLALGYEKKVDWLADPDIQLTQRTYNRLVHAWRVLVVQRQIEPADLQGLDVSKVDIILPAVETGRVKLAKALDDARGMAASDLRESYLKPKVAKPRKETANQEPEPTEPVGTPEAPEDPAVTEPEEVQDAEVVGDPDAVKITAGEDSDGMKILLELCSDGDIALNAWNVSQNQRSAGMVRDALEALLKFVRQNT